jgi:prepilin-type N-terminal cleavage/methylation domain-containing protein
METSQSLRRSKTLARGFALIEVLVALCVLAIGLISLAALTAQMENGTERARFMGLAANLATEKLEDLNRWPSWDPNVYAPSGGTSGSLTTDPAPASVTSNGVTETVSYFDDVVISNNGGSADTSGTGTCGSGNTGAVGETVSGLNNGTTVYTTTYHCADGEVVSVQNNSATAADVNAIEFHRRWTIESNPSINGTTVNNVRRVTVLVTLSNGYMNPPVSFQMSMVRP